MQFKTPSKLRVKQPTNPSSSSSGSTFVFGSSPPENWKDFDISSLPQLSFQAHQLTSAASSIACRLADEPTSPIESSEGAEAVLLAAGNLSDSDDSITEIPEQASHEAFLADISSAEEDELETDWEDDSPALLFEETKSKNRNESSSTESEEGDIFPSRPSFLHQEAWLNTSRSTSAREKVVRILKGDIPLPH